MAAGKNRLGRGLGALISGSAPSGSKKAAAVVSDKTKTISKPHHKPTTKATKPAAKKPTVKPVPIKAASKRAARQVAAEKPTHSAPVSTHNLFLEIPLGQIQPNPHQPRKQMKEEALVELADSIRSEGLLQPIVVRKLASGRFELIAGERRLRACKKIGLHSIPARVLEVSDASSAVLALIENLQREGLDPIEEATGYASLMSDFDLTQEAVAERVGKARASVANALRLLGLDREIQGYLSQGLLSSGHAKVLLGLEDGAHRLVLARKILEQGLSVREAEQAVRKLKAENEAMQNLGGANRLAPITSHQTAIELDSIQKRLTSHLNTKVQLKHTARKGKVVIEYYGERDLERIMEKLGL